MDADEFGGLEATGPSAHAVLCTVIVEQYGPRFDCRIGPIRVKPGLSVVVVVILSETELFTDREARVLCCLFTGACGGCW